MTENKKCLQPTMTLRVGIAGSLEIGASHSNNQLEKQILEVLHSIDDTLYEAHQESRLDSYNGVGQFYSDDMPILHVVSGLAEGVDSIAAGQVSLESWKCSAGIAAILPCNTSDYRLSRASEHRKTLDAQLAGCKWVIELDGDLEKPEPDTEKAKKRRERSYRLQSTVFVRNLDILIAVTDSGKPGSAGGTKETIEKALVMDVPVVVVDEVLFSVCTRTSMADQLTVFDDHNDDVGVNVTVETLVRDLILSTGGVGENALHGKLDGHSVSLLSVFCSNTNSGTQLDQSKSLRSRLWNRFELLFKPDIDVDVDHGHEVWSVWRNHATELSYHYSGLYRGAFLFNYLLAVVAVTAATFSLMLLALGSGKAAAVLETGHPVTDAIFSSGLSVGLVITLLILALIKLICVVAIYVNTHAANQSRWNDVGIDFRYLAERLRPMYYLPFLATNCAPPVKPTRHASRAVSQSAIDWLFGAIVRASSAEQPVAAGVENVGADNNSPVYRISALQGLQAIRDRWVINQSRYHDRTTRRNTAMRDWTEVWAGRLSKSVIVLVVIDVVLLGLKLGHWIPESLLGLAQIVTPILIFITAVLPSAVASLNGVRSQTECERLAERSSLMKLLLIGYQNESAMKINDGHLGVIDRLIFRIESSKTKPANDPSAWIGEALLVTEALAEDITREVAEWTVIYAKDLPEP